MDRVYAAAEAAGLRPTKQARDFKILCPAHTENTASCHVTYQTGPGRTELFCFGCGAEQRVLAEGLGLGLVDLYDDPPECSRCGPGVRHDDVRDCPSRGQRRRPTSAPRGRMSPSRPGPLPKPLAPPPPAPPEHRHRWRNAATYDYPDAQGTLVQQVHRRECTETGCAEKTFTQVFAAADGSMVERKPAGFTPVLYRAPEVAAAVATGRPVWLCEGEKDAETAEALGVAATTNTGGGGAFPAELATVLAGADVRVVLDRDPTGWRRGVAVHELLTASGSRVRLLLPAVETAKADLTDHVAAGRRLEDLLDVDLAAVRAHDAAAKAATKAGSGGRGDLQQCDVEAQLQAQQAAARDEAGAAKGAEQHRANARRWAAEAGRRWLALVDLVDEGRSAARRSTTPWAAAAAEALAATLERGRAHLQAAHAAAGVPVSAELVAGPTTTPTGVTRDADGVEVGERPGNVVDHPTRGRQPWPSRRIPMSRGQWGYETGDGDRPRGVYTQLGEQWVKVAPLPFVKARIQRRGGDGRSVGVDFLLALEEDSEVVMVTTLKLRDGSWANDLGVPLSDDERIAKAASTAIRTHAMDVPVYEAVPRVDTQGRVCIPVQETLPAGYLETAPVEETDALQVWADILRLAAQSPRLALTLGASAVAPFVKALGRQSHFLALYGNSDQGKSITLALAGGIWGDTVKRGGVVRSWNTSTVGVTRYLGELGILPPILDEAGMADLKGGGWGKLIYDLCEGAQRQTAETRGPGVRLSAPWDGVLISAGNGRMTADLGAGKYAGIGKRVIDLPAPFTTSAEHAESLKALLPHAFGHIGVQLLTRYQTSDVADRVQAAADRLGMPAGGNRRTVAKHLHAHVAGAALLDELAGTGNLLQEAASAAAAEYLTEWCEPLHDADRAMALLCDSMATQPAAWPSVAEYVEHKRPKAEWMPGGGSRDDGRPVLPQHGVDRNVVGIRDDAGAWIAVPGTVWKAMCLDEGLDSSVALRELHGRGVLLVTESRRRRGEWTTQMRIPPAAMYKLNAHRLRPLDDDSWDDDPSADPSDHRPDPSADPATRALPDTAVPGAPGRLGAGDPAGWGSVGGRLGAAAPAVTCDVGGIGGVGAEHLRVPAREGPIPSAPAAAAPDGGAPAAALQDAVAPPAPVRPTDSDSTAGEGVVGWTLLEYVDRGGSRRRGWTDETTSPCLGCGLPTAISFEGQPWHVPHWEATIAAHRAGLQPSPRPYREPSEAELARLAAQLDEVTGRRTQEQPTAPEPAPVDDDSQRRPDRGSRTQPRSTSGSRRGPRADRWQAPAAVLDGDAVHLPGGVSQPWPEGIEHAGDLAGLTLALRLGHGGGVDTLPDLGQVWLTAGALERLGLPASLPADDKPHKAALRKLDRHPVVTGAHEAGWSLGQGGHLGVWSRVWHTETHRAGAWVVALPWHRVDAVKLFADDPAPGELADRLARFAAEVGVSYRLTPAATGLDLMDHCRPPRSTRVLTLDGGPAELPAWLHRGHDPAVANLEADYSWWRRWDKLPADDRDRRWVHAWDRGASYLAPTSSLRVGVDGLVHHDRDELAAGGVWDGKDAPGYWRVQAWEWPAWGLPDPATAAGPLLKDHTRWVTTPTLRSLAAHGIEPGIVEAYTWTRTSRYLEGWNRRLVGARKNLAADGGPTAAAVLATIKNLYTTSVGKLGQREHEEERRLWRPDWRHHVVAGARAGILHQLTTTAEASGRYPVVVDRDLIVYTSDDPDPQTAWPGRPDKLGTGVGQWKWVGSAPLQQWGPRHLAGHAGRWRYQDAVDDLTTNRDHAGSVAGRRENEHEADGAA